MYSGKYPMRHRGIPRQGAILTLFSFDAVHQHYLLSIVCLFV